MVVTRERVTTDLALQPRGGGPRSAAREPARLGALDGLRAIAVLAVVVYHLDPSWLPSGYLGVDVFMVVSGFIVTRLLVRERDGSGRIRLAAFWGRRFRRLVPALLFLLVAVALWLHVVGPRTLTPSVREQGLAAIVYVTNWTLIADGVSYGGDIGAGSPLVHLWSLSVEEQFYLVWPILLLGLLALDRGRRWLVTSAVAFGALASALVMAVRYDPGSDPLRIYYGTDTRAQAFLVGALAALLAPHIGPRARRVIAPLGAAALAGALLCMRTDAEDVLYRGGFLALAVVFAIVALATTMPGPVASALDRRPLRALGRVSYGVYLWHWPAVVFLTPARMGFDGVALTATRLGATAAGAGASWVLIERPLARARARRVALVGGVMTAVALAMLLALPASEIVPYTDVRTDAVRAPVVVEPEPPVTRRPVTQQTARITTTSIRARQGLVLPPTGTVMMVGDSGMYSGAPAFAAGLRFAGWRIVDTAYPGMGLTRPEGVRTNWESTARDYGVDLTIVMIGGWDLDFLAKHGAAAYSHVVDDAVAAFTAGDGKVLWLSTLPGRHEEERAIDRVFAALPDRYPGVVEFADIGVALQGPDGGWPQIVDGRRLRGPDGWHLCPDGAAAVTHAALARIGIDRAGWDPGPWRSDPRWQDPPGICDL